ncbi:nucleotide disphospho-sugar-binding domain-containing protein [Streptosporangium sp. NPDC051022]|uniref:nucleotide disphospho-sugar-binding domain-containing protein n=1 Tax=Streptosporangium sp. NPDC051022 TaxID=3155752 RepID=UPI003429CCCB
MRVMVNVLPALGHLFPTVSLTWALRAAGHEVLVTTSAGGGEAAARAGLAVVDVAPGVDIGAIFGQGAGTSEERARLLRERGREIARAGATTPGLVFERFAQVSDVMADETLRVARLWRPDLVIYSRLQGTGLLVAAALDVPAVEHGFNFVREAGFAARYLPYLADGFARHGVPAREPRVEVVHVAPPELMLGQGDGRPMRYVPYNAGGVLPDWLLGSGGRARVLVTLGTVVPKMAGLGGLASLLAAAAETDAEFVLALGDDAEVDALGTLPANVRPVAWVPLHPLLARCDAVVHHGGSGTTLTALAAGVPQLVLPHGADQYINAEVVARHGLGVWREPEEVEPGVLTELLRDGPVRAAARAGAERARELPAPAALVPWLEALARTPAHALAHALD